MLAQRSGVAVYYWQFRTIDTPPARYSLGLQQSYDHLPKDEPALSVQQRAASIAIRHRHAQKRFGN